MLVESGASVLLTVSLLLAAGSGPISIAVIVYWTTPSHDLLLSISSYWTLNEPITHTHTCTDG